MKISPRAATFASISTSSKRSCLMACAADGMSLDIFSKLDYWRSDDSVGEMCTMNLIRRAYVMSFMARNRSDVVARMRIVKDGQRITRRTTNCFRKLLSRSRKMTRLRERRQGWSYSVAQRIANLGNRDEDGSAREGKGTAAEEIHEELWFGEY